MSILTKEIGRYVDTLLDTTDEIVHNDAADDFIDAHADLLDDYVISVIRRYIKDEIKKRTQVAAPAFGQGVLFAGLPAAVTVADGRTKPLRSCTWSDLQVGRQYKVENIEFARESLRLFDEDLALLHDSMQGTELTVAQALPALTAEVGESA